MSDKNKGTKRTRQRRSPSLCLANGREMIGMIQTSGIHRVTITAAPVLMSHNLPEGADHREVHLDLSEDGCKIRSTRLSREMAEALISLLRAAIETL